MHSQLNDFLKTVLTHYGISFPNKINFYGFTRWGKNNRYYAVFLTNDWNNGLYGVHFGDFVTGDSVTAFNRKPLPEEKKWAKEVVDKKKERLSEKDQSRLMNIWASAKPVTSIDDHPYLEFKRIGVVKGLKTIEMGMAGNCLLVPMMNIEGKLIGIQKIHANPSYDGKVFPRKFLIGSRVDGAFFPINTPRPSNVLYIAEGISTAISVAKSINTPCVAAFSASNLPKVAKAFFNAGYRNIVIAADNDCHIQERNVGIEKAKECVPYANKIVFPPLSYSENGNGVDFNDVYMKKGAWAVSDILMAI